MERKNLEAGKKAAEHLAPDPIKHTPEAPIISEEEAQVIESPDGSGPDPLTRGEAPDDVRRQAGTRGDTGQGGIRITPESGERR
jgi:hypothetical protein